MMVTMMVTGAILFGFGMFLWGTIVRSDQHRRHIDRSYTEGFRDGWEAAEHFDDDVRVIWGGNRD